MKPTLQKGELEEEVSMIIILNCVTYWIKDP